MAALRSYQIQSYAFPGFMAKLNRGARYLLPALALPAFFVGLLLFLALVPGKGEFMPDGDVKFEHMIPHVWIDTVTLGMLAVVFGLAAVGARRFWRAIDDAGPEVERRRGFWPSFWSAIGDVLTHRDFKDCEQNHNRAYAHMAIFYGFLLLVAATFGAFLYTVVFDWVGIDWQDNELSLPLWDPVKIIGNVGFLLLLGGGIWVTVRHFKSPEQAGEHSYPDWLFIGIVYAAALTGFGLMALRLAEVPEVAYPFYVVHLLFVYALFVYFPYSKFAHVIYRILANTHAKMLGRRPGEYTGDGKIAAPAQIV